MGCSINQRTPKGSGLVSVAQHAPLRPTLTFATLLDNLLDGQTGLVTNEELIHAFGGITVDLLGPLPDVWKVSVMRSQADDGAAVIS